MADSFDPYAPPRTSLESGDQRGEVFREGQLVRMDRHGQLPGRCIVCNASAIAARFSRRLYWSPTAWRFVAIGLPLLTVGLGVSGMLPAAAMLFWPAVLLLYLIHVFVRRQTIIDAPLCERHARVHRIWLGVSCISLLSVVMLVGAFVTAPSETTGVALFVLIPTMLIVEILRQRLGPLRVGIRRMDPNHVWLRGTGRPFRQSLPEAAKQG